MWDAIDWDGICNGYRRMLVYAPNVFASGVQEVFVERFAADIKRRLTVELQALGHVKRGKPTYHARAIIENMNAADTEATE